MDLGSGSTQTSGSFDKSRVLDAKPLRSLVPIFQSPPGSYAYSSTPQNAPFICVPPTGPFPPGVSPFYPFSVPSENHATGASDQAAPFGFSNNPIQSPVPLTSFRTPTAKAGAANGTAGRSRSVKSRKLGKLSQADGIMDEDGYSESQNQSDQYQSGGFSADVADMEEDGSVVLGRGKSRRKTRSGQLRGSGVDLDTVVNEFLSSFNLTAFDTFRGADGSAESVGYILQIFDLLRRRITQIEDGKEVTQGSIIRRPDLKAGAALMSKGFRTNSNKRIGAVPGVEIGDIFFFRMEICVVGLHSQSMAGIDCMVLKNTQEEEPVAVSIVSSGGYEDNGDDGDVLIYSGQGGVSKNGKQVTDQKLERGNLALEKSLHRGNDVRVIQSVKDPLCQTGRIYVYDGLYRIHESWIEKGKSGCNVFKYKLVRVPGQPEAYTLWKSIQQWKDGVTSRVGVILPDLTSGAENLPVSLVNDVDDEKGPAYFTYVSTLKYSKPFDSPTPSLSCTCITNCLAGNKNCPCVEKNGGFLPYTAIGVNLKYRSLVHECGSSCSCPPSCRNRISQAGLKVRLEVFKTKERGWGLRSWDPIRGGAFICEYAGEVIDISKLEELQDENEDYYTFDATRIVEPLENMPRDPNESLKVPFPLAINAKKCGNVARFMTHSCSPNVYWQPVLRENINGCYLHIAFFAIRHIPPMKELTYDYGVARTGRAAQRRKKCLCGSLKCKGFFF